MINLELIILFLINSIILIDSGFALVYYYMDKHDGKIFSDKERVKKDLRWVIVIYSLIVLISNIILYFMNK